jgi:outer membrane protein OmpA-like peptidoglycan-associated protein
MSDEFARTPLKTPLTKSGLRLAAAVVLVGGLAACSTMESLDPTGMLGGDSAGSTSDTGGLSDAGQAAADDGAQADATPDVASIPDRPQPPSSADQNAQTATSLQADAANVQYSADSLRGGTEAAAPAPAANAPADNTQVAELAPPAAQTPAAAAAPVATPAPADVPADNTTPGTAGASADPPMTEAPAQPTAAPPPEEPSAETADAPAPAEPAPAEQTASAPMTEAPAQPAAAPPPSEPSATAEASPAPDNTPPATTAEATPSQPEAAPSPDATPAPAPVQMASAGPVPGAQQPVTRRAAPGFAPSNAPPLDPSVSQFVSAPVVSRYRQTAMLRPSNYPDYTTTPGYYGPATATVAFPGDTTILDEKGLQQVRVAAELFKSHGGQGYVRIVGYASATSGNLTDARLMHINFDHSQARATTIARALMKEGVPASKVLVDAAPQTAAIAKAEIFVQG